MSVCGMWNSDGWVEGTGGKWQYGVDDATEAVGLAVEKDTPDEMLGRQSSVLFTYVGKKASELVERMEAATK